MNFLDFIKNINKNSLFDESKHKIETSNILIDQSHQNISEETYKSFQKFIDVNNLVDRFQKILTGEICNLSENKPATHFQYRLEGNNFYESNLKNLKAISQKLEDKKIIIFFGIGGSYLASSLLNEVFGSSDRKIIFVTGSDPDEYKDLGKNNLN